MGLHHVVLASLERTIARHSRLLWLKEGDACTQFFHVYASGRCRKTHIVHLKVDGVLLSEHEDKAHAMDCFFHLLCSSPDHGFSLNLYSLCVPAHDLGALEP